MSSIRPLLVLTACIPLLSGCLRTGDIILACSGFETEQVKVGRNLLAPNGTLEQKNRVIEFRAIRQNNLLKEYFEQPRYLVTVDNTDFESSKVNENVFYLSGSESDNESSKEFSFRKESNLLTMKQQVKSGGDSITTTFEGICSEQSRIVK